MKKLETQIAELQIWLRRNTGSNNFLEKKRTYEKLQVQLKQKQINEQFPTV